MAWIHLSKEKTDDLDFSKPSTNTGRGCSKGLEGQLRATDLPVSTAEEQVLEPSKGCFS